MQKVRTTVAVAMGSLLLASTTWGAAGAVPSGADRDRAAVRTSTSAGPAAEVRHRDRARPGQQARRLVNRVTFGAWVGGMTLAPEKLTDFEALIGAPTGVASLYWGYGDVFPGTIERSFARGGTRDLLLSWDMGPTRFAEWTAGEHDDYLDQIVAAARAYPWTVHVRPWPEMNGDWQDFQPTAGGERPHGGTPAEFVSAWRYLVDYFRSRGVTNVRWVFNPTVDTYAGTTPVESIWPGAAYVDVLGLDGFNWGRDAAWGTWSSFTDIFTPQYRRLTALHPTAPVWICEVASKEPAYDDGSPADPRASKGAWVKEMFTTKRFPRVRALVWFQERKERDWRVDSSAASLAAFRTHLR